MTVEREKISGRNFVFMTAEGALNFFALLFFDTNTVIPLFIYTYTGSLELAGMAATIKLVALKLSEQFIAPFVPRIGNLPAFIKRIVFIYRPALLLMIPALLVIGDSNLIIGVFIFVFTFYWIGQGLMGIPWWDVFSRTIPGEKRGSLLGYQQAISGVAGMAGGILLRSVLNSSGIENTFKYSIIFGIAGIMGMASAFTMLRIKDFPRKTVKRKVDFKMHFKYLPLYLLKNREFQKLQIIQAVAAFSGMMVPLLILFSKEAFQLSDSKVSVLIYVQIAGTMAGGFFWGFISRKAGSRHVIAVSQSIGFLVNAGAILCLALRVEGLTWLLVFFGGMYTGGWIGFLNYIIDVVKEKARPNYLVLNSLINLPLALLFYFAGLLAKTWGYRPLFIIGMCAALLAVLSSSRLRSVPGG